MFRFEIYLPCIFRWRFLKNGTIFHVMWTNMVRKYSKKCPKIKATDFYSSIFEKGNLKVGRSVELRLSTLFHFEIFLPCIFRRRFLKRGAIVLVMWTNIVPSIRRVNIKFPGVLWKVNISNVELLLMFTRRMEGTIWFVNIPKGTHK